MLEAATLFIAELIQSQLKVAVEVLILNKNETNIAIPTANAYIHLACNNIWRSVDEKTYLLLLFKDDAGAHTHSSTITTKHLTNYQDAVEQLTTLLEAIKKLSS
jgi:hypothetical protein